MTGTGYPEDVTSSSTIAILGAGRIGEALAVGMISAGWREPGEVVAADRREKRLAEVGTKHGIRTTTSNIDAVTGAQLIVLAVKPQDSKDLLAEIGHSLKPSQTVISVAAGLRTGTIERQLEQDVPVVRVMPNTPVTVQEGISGIAPGTYAGEPHVELAEELLGNLGRTVRVPESLLDAVTAVSGSGPAYFALLTESMIEGGILLGLSREISTDLVVQTMFGTAKLLRDTKLHPVELRESVTSPGGTTVAAIRELEAAGVRVAFFDAMQAALDRSIELAGDDA